MKGLLLKLTFQAEGNILDLNINDYSRCNDSLFIHITLSVETTKRRSAAAGTENLYYPQMYRKWKLYIVRDL